MQWSDLCIRHNTLKLSSNREALTLSFSSVWGWVNSPVMAHITHTLIHVIPVTMREIFGSILVLCNGVTFVSVKMHSNSVTGKP